MRINYMRHVTRQRFFGVHAPNPPTCVHVDTWVLLALLTTLSNIENFQHESCCEDVCPSVFRQQYHLPKSIKGISPNFTGMILGHSPISKYFGTNGPWPTFLF